MKCVPSILRARNASLGRPLREEDIEDLVQDTLAAVWTKVETFEGQAKLESWAFRFCVLEMRNALRRLRRRSRHLKESPAELPEAEAAAMGSSLDFDDVYEGLEQLGEEEGRVVTLKHFSHLTFEECARRLEISPNTAKTRYYRGLSRLKAMLQPLRGKGTS